MAVIKLSVLADAFEEYLREYTRESMYVIPCDIISDFMEIGELMYYGREKEEHRRSYGRVTI